MLKFKYINYSLKEVQIFIGVSVNLADNPVVGKIVEVDLLRVITAGDGNSLVSNEREVLCFSFHNRQLMVGIPKNQREDFYAEIMEKFYKSSARAVVFNLTTRYRNYYTGDIVNVINEKFSIEREMVHVMELDVSDTPFCLPLVEDMEDHVEMMTVHDCIENSSKPHADTAKIRAGNILAYFSDVANAYYGHSGKKKKFYWIIHPKLYNDLALGRVVDGNHIGFDPEFHDEDEREVTVKFTTKDGLRTTTLTFIDPHDVVTTFLYAPHLTIRFRDSAFYGVDLILKDYDIVVEEA